VTNDRRGVLQQLAAPAITLPPGNRGRASSTRAEDLSECPLEPSAGGGPQTLPRQAFQLRLMLVVSAS
jgi:hypothetical protein